MDVRSCTDVPFLASCSSEVVCVASSSSEMMLSICSCSVVSSVPELLSSATSSSLSSDSLSAVAF